MIRTIFCFIFGHDFELSQAEYRYRDFRENNSELCIVWPRNKFCVRCGKGARVLTT